MSSGVWPRGPGHRCSGWGMPGPRYKARDAFTEGSIGSLVITCAVLVVYLSHCRGEASSTLKFNGDLPQLPRSPLIFFHSIDLQIISFSQT